MSVADNFESFTNNLIVPNQDSISTRYKTITRRLNTDFWDTTSNTSHSLYVGSYGRNTAIKGFSDLDMLFQLPYTTYEKYNAYTSNGQSALLQAVKNSLAKTYSSSHVGGDGQVVVINFTDDIRFEILPAFINKDSSYTYPDSNGGGSWKTTNPKPELDAMQARDSIYSGKLRRLCRMMRAWKNEHNVPIKSLLIDTFAYRFVDSWEHNNKSYMYYDWMVRDFLKHLKDQPELDYWGAPGSGSRVYSIGKFQYRANQGYNLALEAIEKESNNYPHSARSKWRELFGTLYP